MDFFSLQIRDKIVFFLVAILLFFLAYSEAFKNLSSYLLIVYFLWSMFTGKIKITQDFINLSIISHLIIVLIGVFVGININESLSQVEDVIHIVLLFLFFREANLNFISYKKILYFLFIGFTFAVLVGIYEIFSSSLNRLELNSVGSVNRSAVYIMYIFVTCLCLRDQYQEKSSRLFFGFIILISLISIILGASRMTLFSLPIILIFYLVLSKKINLKSLIIFGLIILVSIFSLLSFLPDSVLATKLSLGLNDNTRVQIWISSILAFINNNWLFGIGVGNSIFIDVLEYFPSDALSRNIDNPHNVYLDMLLERGVLGLFTFVAFLFSIIKIKDNNYKFLVYIRALVLILLLMGLVNITFRYEFAILFVILIGSYLNPSIKK